MFFQRALTLLPLIAAPALAAAAHDARQETSSASAAGSASAPAGTSSAAAGAASGASSAAGSAAGSGITSGAATLATTYTFSLLSSNPTAVPLSSINAAAATESTIPLPSTASPGATASYLSNGPALPQASIVPSNYPTMDKVPPTDSDQVKQWIQEVKDTGIDIPDISQTVEGGCPSNVEAAKNESNCWWTCSGCTRDTDIVACPDKYTWGLTYDDGPSYYTPNLLKYLDEQQIKSTFFVVGSRVISFPQTLQEEFMSGHQVAVHTWSHPYLTTLTNEQIIAELGWTRQAIRDVIGVSPSMMRPPYGDIDDRVRKISLALGMTPVMWTRISQTATFDTGDFDVHAGINTVQDSLQNWQNILGNASEIDTGFIVLEHDLFQQTVDIATGYILPDAIAHKDPSFTIEPVITCLNKPLADAYVETNDNDTNPPVVSGSAATALSSGAPGSAQATGGSKGEDDNNGAAALRTGATLTALLAVAGCFLTGLSMLGL